MFVKADLIKARPHTYNLLKVKHKFHIFTHKFPFRHVPSRTHSLTAHSFTMLFKLADLIHLADFLVALVKQYPFCKGPSVTSSEWKEVVIHEM